jgi:hypothetical protein
MCHGEPFPSGSKGYLPHHCPGISKSVSIVFINENRHCMKYVHFVITVDNALHCIIKCVANQIISRLQN